MEASPQLPAWCESVAWGQPPDTGLPALRAALVGFCRGFLGDLGEDAAHEVLTKVLAQTTAPDAPPRAWVYRTARNHCIDVCRRLDRRPDDERLSTGFDLARTMSGILTGLCKADDERRLHEAIARLADEEHDCVVLRHLHGLSRPEIEEALGLTDKQVKNALERAMNHLRDALT